MNIMRSTAVLTPSHICGKKKFFASLLKTLGGIALLGCVASASAVAPITTKGSKLLFGGVEGSISGNSMYWDIWGPEKYYNADVVKWLKNDWSSDIVRAAMAVDEEGKYGYKYHADTHKARVKTIVDAAVANNMYVIIDWHSHYAHLQRDAAVGFFREMAETYKNSPNVIFEIYNEPLAVSWSNDIKPYAVAVIDAIRGTGANNLVVVGTPSWSQRVDEAANDPLSDKTNIAYTLHFYAGTHGQWLRDKASYALSKGIPLFVTEWGSVNADGNGGVNYGETDAWVAFMKANKISNANWALSDLNEGSAALTPGASINGGWSDSQLTASGKKAKDIIFHWPSLGIETLCTRVSLPGTIQAENYCNMKGILKEPTKDEGGGENVGYIDAGDWMSYDVDIAASGTYNVSYRVASKVGGGSIQLEKAGGTPTYGPSLSVGQTGDWQNWMTISYKVTLNAGQQTIAISAPAGGYNINWIKVERDGDIITPSSLTIQAESFAVMSGVQTQATTDVGGGLNVGYIDAGDWMSYTGTSLNVPTTASYTVEFRVASQNGTGSFTFEEAGGNPAYTTVTVPSDSHGWQDWKTVSKTITLNAGTHKFGIKANSGGWNINWFRITKN
jgi:endoglucanase